ncbi:MAG TPA: glycosyltransferase [Opitutaceae bacterium]
MTIAHVVASLEERHGGPSRSVRGLAAAAARLGHAVELLTSAPSPAREVDGKLTIHAFRRARPEAICRVPDLAAHLRHARYDVVHHHGLWLRPLHHARANARRERVPLVISPRGMMTDWAWRHRRMRKALAAAMVHPGALAGAAGWHATSEAEAGDIRARGFRQPVCVAPNGVDLPSPEQLAAARAHWHQACPEAAGRRVALFYSRFHEKKRIRELIEQWVALAPRDWLLVLAGIPEQYGVEELRVYARSQGGTDGVRVFNGIGQPPPFGFASLFLLPSHSENFGLAVAEALAAGVPALVTDTMPWSGLHAHQAGWCVPWERHAAALRTALAETPEQLRARGAAGRAWMAAEFSWEQAARKLEAFYAELGSRR